MLCKSCFSASCSLGTCAACRIPILGEQEEGYNGVHIKGRPGDVWHAKCFCCIGESVYVMLTRKDNTLKIACTQPLFGRDYSLLPSGGPACASCYEKHLFIELSAPRYPATTSQTGTTRRKYGLPRKVSSTMSSHQRGETFIRGLDHQIYQDLPSQHDSSSMTHGYLAAPSRDHDVAAHAQTSNDDVPPEESISKTPIPPRRPHLARETSRKERGTINTTEDSTTYRSTSIPINIDPRPAVTRCLDQASVSSYPDVTSKAGSKNLDLPAIDVDLARARQAKRLAVDRLKALMQDQDAAPSGSKESSQVARRSGSQV